MNILLITSDQQHWNTLSCLGSEARTPNLDRLASQGMLFERAYCPNPTCTPTRASMITGRYPSQHGAYSLGTKLPEAELTVGELLQRQGYDCSLIGKAHFQPLKSTQEYPSLESYPLLRDLDYWRGFHGPFYGFNHVELARNHTDEAHVGQHYAVWMEDNGFHEWKDHFQNRWSEFDFSEGSPQAAQEYRWSIPEEFHYNNWIYERSFARLKELKEQEKPFFLWASFFDPHPSYLAPEPWASMYDPKKVTVPSLKEGEMAGFTPPLRLTQEAQPDFSPWKEADGNAMHGYKSHLHNSNELAKDIAVYYGMVSLLDKYVGKVLDGLESLGLADDTLIIFTSDHGHYYGHHGLVAKGAFHYEDGIRVPLIVRWPGKTHAGVRSKALQSLVDLPVSFLRAAGAEVPRSMTGIDQTPVWMGEKPSVRDHILVENRHQPTKLYLQTYVNQRYKISVYSNASYGEMFDLDSDPGELRNLWDEPAAQALKCELLLEMLHANQMKEPVPMPRVSVA